MSKKARWPTLLFRFFSPGRELWHWRRGWGMGVGGGGIRTPKSQKFNKQLFRTKIVRVSGSLFNKSQNNPKNLFKIFSYIWKDTTNPINAFKIRIYNTKKIKNTKIPSNRKNNKKNGTRNKPSYSCFIIYQNSIIHILYILYIL